MSNIGEKFAFDFIQERYIARVPDSKDPITGENDTARTIHIAEDQYWVWTGQVYKSCSERDVENRLLCWLNGKYLEDLNDRDFRWIARNLLAIIGKEGGREPGKWTDGRKGKRWVAFRNGIVNLEDPKLTVHAHNPLFFNRVLIPHSYRPQAECPLWERTVRDWMSGDEQRIRVLQEFTGYCLTEDVSFCSGLFLEGLGSNGKSIFCSTLRYVLGAENVTHIPLEKFHADFAMDRTNGKLLNICNETENQRLPTSRIKEVIDGNEIYVSRKYLPNINITPTVKVVVSWNERPQVKDKSFGFWRRLLLVPFENTYEGDDADPFLLDKLKKEAHGILNWMIEGHRRLYGEGGFSKARTVQGAVNEYRKIVDPCGTFLEARTRCKGGTWISCGELYKAYREWAEMEEVDPETENMFFRAIKRVWKKKCKRSRKVLEGKTTYGYTDLHLIPEEQP